MVNIPPHAQSSHSTKGVAWASLDDDDLFDDEFQSHHTPICHIVWQEEYNSPGLVEGMNFTRGSPTYLPYYQATISKEEEETLQNIDPKWRVHRWLQLAVQDIADDKVP